MAVSTFGSVRLIETGSHQEGGLFSIYLQRCTTHFFEVLACVCGTEAHRAIDG